MDDASVPDVPINGRLQRQLETYRGFAETALDAESMDEAAIHLGLGLKSAWPCAVVSLLSVEPSGGRLVLNCMESVTREFLSKVESRILHEYNLISGKQLDRETLSVEIRGTPPDAAGLVEPGSFFAVPALAGGEVRELWMAVAGKATPAPETAAFLYYARFQIATVLTALNRMRHQARRDVLTGLLNQRGIDEELKRAWMLGQRQKKGTGAIMVDIDHFKSINDSYGHPVGDQVLRELADLLKRAVRGYDGVGRCGGDEFVIILPLTGDEGMHALAARIFDLIHAHIFCEKTQALRVTASIGLADSAKLGRDEPPALILTKADEAMRIAKRNGRDQIC
jgi:diguanylate cyclase (GGDEF)-like protein